MESAKKGRPKFLKILIWSIGLIFFALFLIAMLSIPSVNPQSPNNFSTVKPSEQPFSIPKDMFHAIDSAMVCDDRKITAALHEIMHQPPGTVSDKYLQRLMIEGNCSPIAASVPFKIIRRETFHVPAGLQKIAYCKMKLQNGSNSFFYIMQADISYPGGKQ